MHLPEVVFRFLVAQERCTNSLRPICHVIGILLCHHLRLAYVQTISKL